MKKPYKKTLPLSGQISLSVSVSSHGDTIVDKLIGQDPMGELDKLIKLTINGFDFHAKVSGYASDGTKANLTIYFDDDPEAF